MRLVHVPYHRVLGRHVLGPLLRDELPPLEIHRVGADAAAPLGIDGVKAGVGLVPLEVERVDRLVFLLQPFPIPRPGAGADETQRPRFAPEIPAIEVRVSTATFAASAMNLRTASCMGLWSE